MKKIMVLAFLIGGTGLARLKAQTVSFNFSAAAHTVSGWTNIAGDPSTAILTGASGSVHVSSIATANWAPYNGAAAYDGGGMSGTSFFPPAVMANMWFQYSAYYSAYNAAIPQLEISGLSIDSVYTLQMSVSFNTTTFNFNPTRYTVTGATVYGYSDVYGNSNVSGGAVFNNIAPDANGKIRIYVNTATVGGVSSNTAGISGLQITSGHTATLLPTVALTHPSDNDVIPEDGNINVSATASESGGTIAKVEFYADTTKIGEATTAPYSIVWLSPDAGHYALKARAIDGLGNTSTSTINISIESLSSFWSMTGNSHMNPDSNFIGNVDSVRLAFRTKNIEQMSLSPTGSLRLNQYKNDSAGTSFLSTDTLGVVKLKPLKFTNGLTKSGDSVVFGGQLMTPIRLWAKNSSTDTQNTNYWTFGGSGGGQQNIYVDTTWHSSGTSSMGLSTNGRTSQLALTLLTQGTSAPYSPSFVHISAEADHVGGTGNHLTFSLLDSTGSSSFIMLPKSASFTAPGIQFSRFKNNASGDSVLITDTLGNLKQKSLSSFNSFGHWQTSGSVSYDSLDNIGIGTSNTQGYKLAVNGSAIFTRIKVKTQSAWPDYVFKKEYRLPQLKDLEEYIKTHQHLPGVQTAEDVNRDGQDLGANQAILLKKMEEMTLYIIELNKKVEKLSQENEQLKKGIHLPNGRKSK